MIFILFLLFFLSIFFTFSILIEYFNLLNWLLISLKLEIKYILFLILLLSFFQTLKIISEFILFGSPVIIFYFFIHL